MCAAFNTDTRSGSTTAKKSGLTERTAPRQSPCRCRQACSLPSRIYKHHETVATVHMKTMIAGIWMLSYTPMLFFRNDACWEPAETASIQRTMQFQKLVAADTTIMGSWSDKGD